MTTRHDRQSYVAFVAEMVHRVLVDGPIATEDLPSAVGERAEAALGHARERPLDFRPRIEAAARDFASSMVSSGAAIEIGGRLHLSERGATLLRVTFRLVGKPVSSLSREDIKEVEDASAVVPASLDEHDIRLIWPNEE